MRLTITTREDSHLTSTLFDAEVAEMQFSKGSEGVTVAAQYEAPPSKMEQMEMLANLKDRLGDINQLRQNASVLSAVPDAPQS